MKKLVLSLGVVPGIFLLSCSSSKSYNCVCEYRYSGTKNANGGADMDTTKINDVKKETHKVTGTKFMPKETAEIECLSEYGQKYANETVMYMGTCEIE